MSALHEELCVQYPAPDGQMFSVIALCDPETGEDEGYDVWLIPNSGDAIHLNSGEVLWEVPSALDCERLLNTLD